jgi:phosphoribosylformylglycinamidine (FGAM) synthase-like amidotransferase family enzyme
MGQSAGVSAGFKFWRESGLLPGVLLANVQQFICKMYL